MKPYDGYTYPMESIKRIAIRAAVEDMVGECNDFQIMFCAAAVGRIQQIKATLEDLTNNDLESLYLWVVEENRFSTYA